MDYFTPEINFLGITLTKVGNKLERDLYSKPTDTHQYLMHSHVAEIYIKDLLHTDRL